MVRYAVKRIAVSLGVLLAASVVMFVVVSLTVDPLAEFASRDPAPTPETMAQLRHQMRLDQPLAQQYVDWINGIFSGDLGPSIRTENLEGELFGRMGVTLRLIFAAVIVSLIAAIALGLLSAVRPLSWQDRMVTLLSFVMLSTPLFWLAYVLKEGAIAVNNAVGQPVFSTIGDGSTIAADGVGARMAVLFGVLLLPTIAISLPNVAQWSRFLRGSMLDIMDSSYIQQAKAKGLAPVKVVFRHAFRCALGPLLMVAAIGTAELLAGAVLAEQVFQWQGLGSFILQAVHGQDTYGVLAWLLFSGVIVLVGNLLADLLHARLDPRVKYE